MAKVDARPRLPITPAILRSLKMVWAWESNHFSASMLWAAACLCFFDFLWLGEIVVPSESLFDAATHLCFGDIHVSVNCLTDVTMTVHLKSSKTNPYRRGVLLVIGMGSGEICPVAVVFSYMVLWGPAPGPPFHFSDGPF